MQFSHWPDSVSEHLENQWQRLFDSCQSHPQALDVLNKLKTELEIMQ